MKTIMWNVMCVAAVLAANPVYAGQASSQTTVAKPSDSALDSRIERRFKADASLHKYGVKVNVEGAVATISGTVATDTQRARAARLAAVQGVARVDNQIAVDASVASKSTSGTLAKVGEKTKEGAEKVADKTKEGLSKTGEVITDAWINTRVHGRFVNEDLLKDSNIDVDVKDHLVTLNGTVMSRAGSARATTIAKGTEGVHRVVNHLTVGPKKS